MDDEGCRCRTREFVELSDFLRRRGVYVPAVTAKDFDNGFLLLEDLGDLTVTKALTADNEMKLYQKAGEAIAKIAAIRERPQCAGELSRRRIIDDVRLFTQWYFPMAAGFPLPDDAEKNFSKFSNACPKWLFASRSVWFCGTITLTTSCCRPVMPTAPLSTFRMRCGDR